MLGRNFALRMAELRELQYKAVEVDEVRKQVRVSVRRSKMYGMGRGCRRALSCECGLTTVGSDGADRPLLLASSSDLGRTSSPTSKRWTS